ncbi:MAG: hypothetical protein SGJ20_12000 [Planctomycetota bacterium]|nr:hypothetical protein [Planctomycetota bacterium]
MKLTRPFMLVVWPGAPLNKTANEAKALRIAGCAGKVFCAYLAIKT